MTKDEIERFLTKYTESDFFYISLATETDRIMTAKFHKLQENRDKNLWLLEEFVSKGFTQETEIPGEFILKMRVAK